MTDFTAVSKALNEGADPNLLCATCPWDRNCISPPSVTKAQIDAQIKEADAQIKEAEAKDKELADQARLEGKPAGMPVGLLMASIIYSGRDTSAAVCPVFALRLSSSSGRQIVDGLKTSMQGWDDQS